MGERRGSQCDQTGMKFVCDSMLGRLARWLRILGFDCTYEGEGGESALLRLSVSEERTILTRNRKLARAHPERSMWIESERVEGQLSEMDRSLHLRRRAVPFSRCSVCNAPLIPATRERVKGKVPYYVYRTCEAFSYCPVCHHHYWEGTHHEAIKRKMTELLKWPEDWAD